MFMFLNLCSPESQEKILQNWNRMLKEHKQKEETLKFIRENPPITFKDMYIYGNLMSKYGDDLYKSTSKPVIEEPVSNSWFNFW